MEIVLYFFSILGNFQIAIFANTLLFSLFLASRFFHDRPSKFMTGRFHKLNLFFAASFTRERNGIIQRTVFTAVDHRRAPIMPERIHNVFTVTVSADVAVIPIISFFFTSRRNHAHCIAVSAANVREIRYKFHVFHDRHISGIAQPTDEVVSRLDRRFR